MQAIQRLNWLLLLLIVKTARKLIHNSGHRLIKQYRYTMPFELKHNSVWLSAEISLTDTSPHFFGMMKCSSAQSSLREFCSGVPVISMRWFVSKPINVLYSRESSFFSRWASSTPNTAQLMLCRNDCIYTNTTTMSIRSNILSWLLNFS